MVVNPPFFMQTVSINKKNKGVYMAKKITTKNELNQAIYDCVSDLLSVGASSKGDKFDETVKDKFVQYLPNARLVETKEWCSKSKHSIYREHYKRTLKYQFDFTDISPIIDNGQQLDLLIVNKPNGDQRWPDLLIIYNGIGLPIEVKSCKTDKVVWNGGLPRFDSMYIFNCYGKSKTTCFLGQHVMSKERHNKLIEKATYLKRYNESDIECDYYIRNMFGSKKKYFENDDEKKTALKNNSLIIQKENELKELGEFGHKGTIGRLNREIGKLNEQSNNLLIKYKKEQENRLFIEKETFDYIFSLTWDWKQKNDYDLGFDDTDADDDLDNENQVDADNNNEPEQATQINKLKP